MPSTLDDCSELWACLLALRAHVGAGHSTPLWLSRGPHPWQLHDAPRAAEQAFAVLAPSSADNGRHDARSDTVPSALRLYLPIISGTARARARGGVHVTGHLAQTLDGRIACLTGDSQWIGNAGNLRHAHRLRALHDAVLVGSITVDRDNPALTVRHVAGRNPRRVVLNGSASTLDRRADLKVFADPGCVLVCARAHAARARDAGVDVIELDPLADGSLPIPELLAALATRGLHSLFVEGGGYTLSRFLAADSLDLLHLHIAPLILGSGVPTFALPVVERLTQARRFHSQHFDVDGELLVACAPMAARFA